MREFLFKAWVSLCGMAAVAIAPDALSAQGSGHCKTFMEQSRETFTGH